jgi:hypothetical protein
MADRDADVTPLHEPLAELERQLICAYLTNLGHDLEACLLREDTVSRKLLTDASQFASEQLCQVEARFHYLRALHGVE